MWQEGSSHALGVETGQRYELAAVIIDGRRFPRIRGIRNLYYHSHDSSGSGYPPAFLARTGPCTRISTIDLGGSAPSR